MDAIEALDLLRKDGDGDAALTINEYKACISVDRQINDMAADYVAATEDSQ